MINGLFREWTTLTLVLRLSTALATRSVARDETTVYVHLCHAPLSLHNRRPGSFSLPVPPPIGNQEHDGMILEIGK